jgi:drug/metabolite transporter (DMT)-like permease
VSGRIVAAYFTCAVIWGTTWFAIRVTIRPGGFPTFASLALRFAIAAVVLLPLALRVRPWPRGKAARYLVLAGVLDAAGYTLVYLGEERISGGIASVVYGTQPLVLGILLSIVKFEKVTRRHVIGALISLAGVSVLFLDRLELSSHQALGVVFVLASVVVATTYSAIMKVHGGGVPALVSTTVFIVVTALVLGVVALAIGEPIVWPPDVEPTIALLYLALIGSALAFVVYFWLLEQTSLTVTSTLVLVFPLVALLTDALFERAIPLGASTYLGAAITLSGLAVSLRRR